MKVKCEIKIPEDAEPGKYVGLILVGAENVNITETINITINVLKDTIPPEIEIYSPKDGEIVNRLSQI